MALPSKNTLAKSIEQKMSKINTTDTDNIPKRHAEIMAEIILDTIKSMEITVTAGVGKIVVNTGTGQNVTPITIGNSEIT